MKRFYLVLIVAIALLGWVQNAASFDLKALQEELHKRGDPWIAGKTSVSDLSLEEKRKLCNNLSLKASVSESRKVLSGKPTKAPPSAWDWRNYNGENWMTPAKDQGACAYTDGALLSVLEARIKIYKDLPDSNPDFSEDFFCKCFQYSPSKLDSVAIFIVEKGIPEESWQESDGCDLPDSLLTKAASWGQIPDTATDLALKYKQEIMNGPCACVMQTVKEDFFYYMGGTYTPIMGDNLTANNLFNHGICLCGWNDTRQGWLFKNSWGTAWGENGYAYLSYGGEGGATGPSLLTWVTPIVGVEEKVDALHKLSAQVFPTPTQCKAYINFSIPDARKVIINVYDIAGKLIYCLTDKVLTSGDYRIVWDGKDLSGKKVFSGIYFVKLVARDYKETKKIVLMK